MSLTARQVLKLGFSLATSSSLLAAYIAGCWEPGFAGPAVHPQNSARALSPLIEYPKYFPSISTIGTNTNVKSTKSSEKKNYYFFLCLILISKEHNKNIKIPLGGSHFIWGLSSLTNINQITCKKIMSSTMATFC